MRKGEEGMSEGGGKGQRLWNIVEGSKGEATGGTCAVTHVCLRLSRRRDGPCVSRTLLSAHVNSYSALFSFCQSMIT